MWLKNFGISEKKIRTKRFHKFLKVNFVTLRKSYTDRWNKWCSKSAAFEQYVECMKTFSQTLLFLTGCQKHVLSGIERIKHGAFCWSISVTSFWISLFNLTIWWWYKSASRFWASALSNDTQLTSNSTRFKLS